MIGFPGTPLQIFPYLTLIIFLVPIFLGLIGTWLPAFGYFPVIGAHEFSLRPFYELFSHPSLPAALRSTLISGISATLVSLLFALFITIHLYSTGLWRLLEKSLAPLLAIPHAAFAIGFAFLIAPSGWLIRVISPWLSGYNSPPDLMITGDPWALSLSCAMICKEIPFLLLIIISGLSQLDTKRTIWVGRSLGYNRFRIWTRLIIPQLYPMLRLPVLAVLAYSLSVVDLALIIGPSLPPTLAVLIDRWFNDPDVSQRFTGAAAATILCCIITILIIFSIFTEQLLTRVIKERLTDGKRTSLFDRLTPFSPLPSLLVPFISGLCLIILIIWSIAQRWRFPDALPESVSWFYWSKSLQFISEPMLLSLLTGIFSSTIAIVLVLGCFENERHLPQTKIASISKKSLWIIYLPLLIPQISFLFGAQTAFIKLRLDGTWLGMIWIHLVFVLPYVFLTLASAYRNYDQRYFQSAAILCGSPWRSFLLVKVPMLLKPILFSIAVGFAVSIAQYLPTLYAGAGRFATITTETVSLAGGSDRRVIAVYALCQFLLPLLFYTIAIWFPSLFFINRREMQN